LLYIHPETNSGSKRLNSINSEIIESCLPATKKVWIKKKTEDRIEKRYQTVKINLVSALSRFLREGVLC